MFAKKKPAAVAFPSLAEVEPGYAALIDKQRALRSEINALTREADEIRFSVENDPHVAEVDASAAELLGDLVVTATSSRLERLTDIQRQVNARSAALRILGPRLHDAEVGASKKVRAAAVGTYRDKLAVLARSLIVALQADRDFRAVQSALDDTGAVWVQAEPAFVVPSARWRWHAITLLKEALEAKAIAPVEVPEGLIDG